MGKQKATPLRARQPKNGRPETGNEPDWDHFIEILTEKPWVRAACAAIGVNPSSACRRYQTHEDFAKAWDAATMCGALQVQGIMVQLALGQWQPVPGEEDCEPPSVEAAKLVLRALMPERWSPVIKLKTENSLADLRAKLGTPEGRAEVMAMGVELGLVPSE